MAFFESAFRDILKKMGKEGHDPSPSIKPSSLYCPRKMTFEMMQVPPKYHNSAESVLRMEDGSSVHEMIEKMFDKHLPAVRPGWTFQYEIKLTAENCTRAAPLFIRCKLDGYGNGPDGNHKVVEFKTTGENQMAALKTAKKEHVEQLNTYMYLLDVREGEVLYFNRGNLADIRGFDHIFDPELWAMTEAKIHRVLEATMEGKLPPTDVNPFWCRDCQYSYCCKNREKWVDANCEE